MAEKVTIFKLELWQGDRVNLLRLNTGVMMDNEQQEKIERRWKKYQEMLNYTDDELAIFRSNPKNVKAMEHAPKFITHRIIVEVAEAHNCPGGHKAGDKIAIMTGNALLLTEEMPKYVCAFGLAAAVPRIYAIWERFYEDLDPNGMLHEFLHCPDVGCRKGGAGEIIMRIYAEEIPRD